MTAAPLPADAPAPAPAAPAAPRAVPAGPRGHLAARAWRRISGLAAHAYIWLCLLVFVMPFLALLFHSLEAQKGVWSLDAFQYVLGSFGENLASSFLVTGLTLVIDLVVCLPAAYALVRYPVPGRRFIFALLTLPLYVPGAVLGIALVLTFNFTYHTSTIWGLVLAMAVGSFPLMLTPIVVSLKDLPISFEEAAECLGATRWQAYRRIVLPLLGPGIGAGLLLVFIIVFNEYLVTLFVHPPGLTTAPLRVFNLVRTAGLAPTTTALAVTMQVISFIVVLVFFRVFGTRHLKGTYFV
ncbi:MAG: ABC transporter permease subunit [Chloroflexota bacterium]